MPTRHHGPMHRPGLRLHKQETGAALLDAHGREVGALDATAAALWELCDGETTTEEIVTAVCEVWAVDPETARHDIQAALGRLAEAGFVEWPEGHPS
jgi:hypothetical protein